MAFKGTPGAIADAFQNAFRQRRDEMHKSRLFNQKMAEEQRQFGLLQRMEQAKLAEDARQADIRDATNRDYYGNSIREKYLSKSNMPQGVAEQYGLKGILGSVLQKTTGFGNYNPDETYYKMPPSGMLGGSGGGSGSGDVSWQYNTDASGNAIAFNPKTLQVRTLERGGNPLKSKSSDFSTEIKALGDAWGELQSFRPGGTLKEVDPGNKWERMMPNGDIVTMNREQVAELREKAFQKVKTVTDAAAKAYNKENPEFEATYKILLRNSDPSKIDSEVHKAMDGEFSPDAIRMMKELLKKRIF